MRQLKVLRCPGTRSSFAQQCNVMVTANTQAVCEPRERARCCSGSVHGFTLVELMVVIAIIAIMALAAIPSIQDRTLRAQLTEGLALADVGKAAVAAAYAKSASLPTDNDAAGLPPADRIVGNRVSAVTVRNGAVHLRFGNQVHKSLMGKTLSFRPAVVDDYPQVPIAWICGSASVPDKMTAKGDNLSDLPQNLLPPSCRSGPPPNAAP